MKISARVSLFLSIVSISALLLTITFRSANAQNDDGFENNVANEIQYDPNNQVIINSDVSSTLNDIYKKKELELKKKPINYEFLIQAVDNDYTKISKQYESFEDKTINTSDTSIDELSAVTSLTITRYLVLNKYLFESRIVLEESLELLDKSGFDKERILGQIDKAYEQIIANQAELAAYSYILQVINENPNKAKDYHNYILKRNRDMDIRYQDAFQEIKRIIEVSLF